MRRRRSFLFSLLTLLLIVVQSDATEATTTAPTTTEHTTTTSDEPTTPIIPLLSPNHEFSGLGDWRASTESTESTTTSTTTTTTTVPPTTTTTIYVTPCDRVHYNCTRGYCEKTQQMKEPCSCKQCTCPTACWTGRFCEKLVAECDWCAEYNKKKEEKGGFFSRTIIGAVVGEVTSRLSGPGIEVCPNDNYDCDSSTGVKNCTCKEGFTGMNCEFEPGNKCANYPCLNGGTCKAEKKGFSCTCASGWTGPQCQTASDICSLQRSLETCKPNGYTKSVLDGTRCACHCHRGWQGKTCEEKIELPDKTYCNATACRTGYCVEEQNGFSCVCRPGTVGDYCDKPHNPCTRFGCLNKGKCWKTVDNSTAWCTCESGYSGPKCADVDHCFFAPCKNGGTCEKASNTTLGYTCTCASLYHGDNCENYSACSSSPCENGGKCSDVGERYYECDCGDGWMGRDCNQDIDECALAAAYTPEPIVLCANGGTCVNTPGSYHCACSIGWKGLDCNFNPDDCNMTYTGPDGNEYPNLCIYLDKEANCTDGLDTYTCNCTAGFKGERCWDDIDECAEAAAANETLCENFGECINTVGSYHCECITGTEGFNCSINPNDCEISNSTIDGVVYPNECIARDKNATCTDGFATYTCTCSNQWTGPHCLEDVDECAFDPSPCINFATCNNLPGDYECFCINGTQGKNCDDNPNDCINVTACNTVDEKANCTDGFASYTCTCGPDYTMQLCDLELIIWNVLQLIGGGSANEFELIAMLRDLLRNPSKMKDLVPFIIGLQSTANRSRMSWDVDDMFLWVAYEERTLDLRKDLFAFNDVVLGNCFTFNHFNNTDRSYLMRSAGAQGGLKAALKLNSQEYVPWTETTAITAFIHPNTETIFSESPRYNAEPSAMTTIQTKESRYIRLGGLYGRCVKSANEVASYYYDGSYTTDGCLRSCYQDEVKKACQCMDSRYPKPENEVVCELPDRKCVDSITAKGDVSTWADCVCPLPCENSQFDSSYTVVPFVRNRNKCNAYTAAQRAALAAENNTSCEDPNQPADYVIINVQVPRMIINIFEETPAWTLNRLVGNIGGLGGVVCGLNLITFFEFGFYFFFQLPMTLLFNQRI